ncbi:hypothetical protein BJ170DRAFT_609257 [Xylariales sp. AK1849]|nr:hypothetical protein BJ170DRAFT_609257 [Xylariales sp. AK1849]
MRVPFICRQCLSLLRQPSSRPQHLARVGFGFHTQTRQDQQPASSWQVSAESAEFRPQEEHASGRGEEEQVTKQIPIRRYHERRDHVGKALGRGSATRLKTMILDTKGDFEFLQEDIGNVYGLPRPTAREAVGQLRRLFWGRQRGEAAELLDEFGVWKMEYGKLLKHLSTTGPRADSYHATGWATFDGDENPSIESMKSAWSQLDQVKRKKLWSRMVLSILDSNSGLLASFVRATYEPSWPESYVVEDLVRVLLLRANLRKTPTQDLVDLVFYLLETNPHVEFSEDVFAAVLSCATLEQAEHLFRHLTALGKVLKPQTSLQFASRFAKSKEHKVLAAETLCSMSTIKGFDINTPAASSICTSLLHLTDGDSLPQGRAAPDELFKILLEHGLRPNLLNLSALMRNFCVRGYLDTAWKVFDLLLEYGIEPDKRVYSILLHAAKKINDIASIRRIMSVLHSQNNWNAPIINGFLDIMFRDNEAQPELRRRQRRGNNAFRPMLQVYAKFFRLEPLQKLCSFSLEDYLLWRGQPQAKNTQVTDLAAALLPQPESQLMNPDTITLTLMLSASIRSLPRNQRRYGARPLLRHYHHFNRLFQAGDLLAISIVEKHGTLIYDIFLRGMLQFQECLRPAVHLVRNMLRIATEEQQKHGRNIRHPRPSVHTWTILVNGFKNHRQASPATSMVKMMMREGGVKPNMATWNALIGAFAQTHNARGAVRAMRYMEQSGLKPDRYTVQALSSMNFTARQQALALMEASKDQPLPQDEVGMLVASVQAAADQVDPVLIQQTNKNAPPLSEKEVRGEMQRLITRGDELLSQGIETFTDSDFPEPLTPTSSEPFGQSHPRNTDHLRRLLEYRDEVATFIELVCQHHRDSTQPLISSTSAIAKLRRWIASPFDRDQPLRQSWEEANEARNQIRALKFSKRPVGVVRGLNIEVPLGVVARRGQAPHPRVAANRYANPSLRRDLSKGGLGIRGGVHSKRED